MSTTKTAKPSVAVADVSSSRRSQPVRQTRTNPPRTTAGPGRTYTRDSIASVGAVTDQPIDIFPAVAHFVDAISALPRELVKHFTLLKEVDAKVHLPEQNLFQLIDAALATPIPDLARSSDESSSSVHPASAPMSTQNSSTGPATNGQPPAAPSTDESLNAGVFDPSNLPRRQLFRQVAIEIKEMLVSLEEKNHVISTANDALHKQLARIDDVWPHLENEFSDEAKWGSTTHWAYPENRAGRSSNAQAERSRREGAARLSAAAQQIAEEAAARSDARKQAVALKKSLKNQHHHESDFDDHDNKQKGEGSKKTGGGKSRKAPTADSPATVGLGISNTSAVNGTNPAPKRRKVEKTAAAANGGAPMERAMSSVFGANAGKPKASSPRETPAPEGAATKKRKALPTGGGSQTKKRCVWLDSIFILEGCSQTNKLAFPLQSQRSGHVAVGCLVARRWRLPRLDKARPQLSGSAEHGPAGPGASKAELNPIQRRDGQAAADILGVEQAQWRLCCASRARTPAPAQRSSRVYGEGQGCRSLAVQSRSSQDRRRAVHAGASRGRGRDQRKSISKAG